MTAPATMLQLACLACGNSFAAEKPRRGRHPRFCSPDCKRARHLSQAKGYRAEGRYPPRTAPVKRRPISKTCEICQQPFQTTNHATVCCGQACGQILSHRRSAATRTARSIEQRRRVCEHCGTSFVARHPSGKARAGEVREGRFCSRRCAAEFRASGGKAVPVRASLFGAIMNCAFGDRFRQRAADGDADAQHALASFAPVDIPARAQLAWRDAQIRMVATRVFAALPKASCHSVAGILAAAGRDLQRQRGLTGRPPFHTLAPDEIEQLEKSVRYVVETGVHWPDVRAIENILSV